MKVGYRVLIIISSILVLGLFALIFTIFTQKPTIKVTEITECLNATSVEKADCYAQAAYSQGNSSLCGLLQGTENINECYKRLATAIYDDSLCDKIKSDEDLSFSCHLDVAINLKDAAPCAKVENSNPNQKDLCYASVAGSANNATFCESVQEPDLKNQCLAATTKDTSFCANIRDPRMKQYPCTS